MAGNVEVTNAEPKEFRRISYEKDIDYCRITYSDISTTNRQRQHGYGQGYQNQTTSCGYWRLIMPPGGKTVRFTEQDVKNHLDKCIRFWRSKRDKKSALNQRELEERDMAPFYIDAYQSVRVSLFGKVLEK